MSYLCTRFQLRIKLRTYQAQMAESVDALVSNTSGATRAGSTPALGTSSLSRKRKCCRPSLAALFLFHVVIESSHWDRCLGMPHTPVPVTVRVDIIYQIVRDACQVAPVL